MRAPTAARRRRLPRPPPQDKYALGAAIKAAPSWLKFSQWTTSPVHEITSIAQLFKNGRGITEHVTVKNSPVKDTSPDKNTNDNTHAHQDWSLLFQPIALIGPQAPAGPGPGTADSSANSSGVGGGGPPDWIQQELDLGITPANGGTINETSTPATSTSGAGSTTGGGQIPPTGNAADCDPQGGDLGELVSGKVPYGSSVFSRMIQDERLRLNDRTGNYAIGCLEDGTIVMGRFSGDVHAEESVIRQAGLRRIIDLYSERAPCQERCSALTGGMNTSWSFDWNPPEIRPQSTAEFRAAMQELFGSP